MEKTDAEIKNLNKLYLLYDTVIKSMNQFRERSWAEVNRDDLEKMNTDAATYEEQCKRLPKDLKEWAAYKELKKRIEDLKEVMPLIIELKKPSIRERHWISVKEITGKNLNYENPDQMTIDDLLTANLLNFIEDVTDITDSADKQLKIENQMREIKEYWSIADFSFNPWGKRE